MVALKVEDVRAFTSKLFVKEDFDRFLVKEVHIVTYNTFTIDGHIRREYYSEEEMEEGRIEPYSSWEMIRPFCFSLVKGKKLPGSFHIVLALPSREVDQFACDSGTGISGDQIQGLYLNIRYQDGALYCVTGTSVNFFTLDKTLETEWDNTVRAMLRTQGIECT